MADYLSRMPNPHKKPSLSEVLIHKIDTRHQMGKLHDLPISDILRNEVKKDPIVKKVNEFLKTGWRLDNLSEELRPYLRKRCELPLEDKILMWHGRIVVPYSLRNSVMKFLHKGHPGISAMRALARHYVWWPSIDEDIDMWVKRCSNCQENRPNITELPVYSWSIPDDPWERVHVDFAGPFEGKFWLVLCDALSKWIEIKPMSTITTTKLCNELDTSFTSFSLPQIIVSDNGPQFTSQQFQEYCKCNGIRHVKSSPYHPRTNSLAERLVRTLKTRMSASTCDELSSKKRLENFLFTYRITPRTDTGKSPAEILLGRQLRCLLDNIKPNPRRSLRYRQFQANIEHDKEMFYNPGENVYVRSRDDKYWKPATVTRRTHRYSYLINTPVGMKKFHADQIRKQIIEEHLSPPNNTQDSQGMQQNIPTCSKERNLPLASTQPVVQAQFEIIPMRCNDKTPKYSTKMAFKPNVLERSSLPPTVEG
ncbi:uncharacterized protein K02A2.6-like [Galleria mellonella]|uniref:RNA-directed DNA polymerase n=1 Tax=Galleria mellonella TaxID=7137 RepID=A0ABM3MTW3_GALME|nr:uncharacterized protein K02A2.6-like [Galleria mellonella]